MDVTPEIAGLLEPGERVLWSGRPDPDRLARGARVLVGIGALFLLTSIAFFLILRVILSPWLALAGLPFAAMGLVMMAAPASARRHARRTAYALTDRRAIVRRPTWRGGTAVEQFAPRLLDEVTRVDERDGLGDLVFFVRETSLGEGMVTARKGFQAIPHADEVESLVRRTLLADPAETSRA